MSKLNLPDLSRIISNDRAVDSAYESIVKNKAWDQGRRWLADFSGSEEAAGWRYFAMKSDILVHTNEYALAFDAVEKAQARHSNKQDERLLVQKAGILYYLKKYEEALLACETACRMAPHFLLARIQHASVLMALYRFKEAEKVLYGILRKLPNDYQTRFNYASCLYYLAQPDAALKELQWLDSHSGIRPEPARLRAKIYLGQGEVAKSVDTLVQATTKYPEYLPNWVDLCYLSLKEGAGIKLEETLARARIHHPHTNTLELVAARIYGEMGQYHDAKAAAKRAIIAARADPAGPLELARLTLDSGDPQEAGKIILALKGMIPDDWRVHELEGALWERMHVYPKAEEALNIAVQLSPRDVRLALRYATVLRQNGKTVEAKELLEKIGMVFSEDSLGVAVERLIAAIKDCDWSEYDELLQRILTELKPEHAVKLPLLNLYAIPEMSAEFLRGLADGIAVHNSTAMQHLRKRFNFPPSIQRKGKLRIGFASMDFRSHALSYLMAQVFELFDHSRFEIIAYSYGPDDKSPMRSRMMSAFNAFNDIRALSDVAACHKIASDGIHILVDLAGYTRFNRVVGIFGPKPAPVTAHALGYTFTLGKDVVDYMITDPFVAELQNAPRHYAEKMAYLPCMYPSDTRYPPGQPIPRSQLGLPDDAFVFCCFNQAYKLNRNLLDAWSLILSAIPDSIFWGFRSDPSVEANLKKEFALRGIETDRIIMSQGVPLSEHYNRLQAANMALDTTPYCSGTTANNALWCGVPLLGLQGDKPSSRGSSSQLNAVGLSQFICCSFDEYVEKAIYWASHREELKTIKKQLFDTVHSGQSILFNPKSYTRAFEDLLEQMWWRYEQGLSPDTLWARCEWPQRQPYSAYRVHQDKL